MVIGNLRPAALRSWFSITYYNLPITIQKLFFESISIVTGPSFTSSTSIIA